MGESMSPWTPEMIGKLTPIQLYCLGHKRPPSHGDSITTSEEYEQSIKREEDEWYGR